MAATKTALLFSRQQLPGGLVKKIVAITLTGTYPTGGVPILPADCLLSRFEAVAGGLTFRDPVVTQASDPSGLQNHIAVITGGFLRYFYPSGGGAAAPTTPAQPAATTTPAAGATAVTSTGAQPAMAAVITPGLGKEFPNNAAVTNFSFLCEAVGVE